MTNYFPQQNIPTPYNYSGVTIQITSPTVNAGQVPQYCSNAISPQIQQMPSVNAVSNNAYPAGSQAVPQYGSGAYVIPNQQVLYLPDSQGLGGNGQQAVQNVNSSGADQQSAQNVNSSGVEQQSAQNTDSNGVLQAYPQQYYLNNYGTVSTNEPSQANSVPTAIPVVINNQQQENSNDDLASSKEIISELNAMVEEQKEAEKNGKSKEIVALTNEYIMSLENYLNNQDTEIRLMAAKEVLTRLDEDHSRHDDPALNALVNKMLQDPEKLVRVAAFSALSSGLAGGNDFTYELMQRVQNDPNADKSDVLEAANILLRMSGTTETIYTSDSDNTKRQKTEMKVRTEESNE